MLTYSLLQLLFLQHPPSFFCTPRNWFLSKRMQRTSIFSSFVHWTQADCVLTSTEINMVMQIIIHRMTQMSIIVLISVFPFEFVLPFFALPKANYNFAIHTSAISSSEWRKPYGANSTALPESGHFSRIINLIYRATMIRQIEYLYNIFRFVFIPSWQRSAQCRNGTENVSIYQRTFVSNANWIDKKKKMFNKNE